MQFPVTEHVVKTPRNTSFYLACGVVDAPLIIFVHGWPELSISWRHQLHCFASLGFRVIAPDMRGYGRSTVHRNTSDYSVQAAVTDMIELLDSLGSSSALWVGHDWGAPVVWGLAQHHPARVEGAANLCVPYLPEGFAPVNVIPLVDRSLYPANEYPAGQWDYQLFYAESFDRASATFDANPRNLIKALFRKGDPAGRGKPGRLATVRRDGGWFGGAAQPPDVPMDRDLLTDEDLHRYASALESNGFRGPDSWYVNAEANVEFARRAQSGGRLSMPVLFFHAAYDYTCETVTSALPRPMRETCDDLTEVTARRGQTSSTRPWPAGSHSSFQRAGNSDVKRQEVTGSCSITSATAFRRCV